MRSILVHAAPDRGMAARLDTALAIARYSDGHVTLVIDTPVERFVTADMYGGAIVASEALEAALADDAALEREFTLHLARGDVPFDVARFETSTVEALTTSAQLADLAIVSRQCGCAGDLAVAARCPVLVFDDPAPLRMPLKSACIAWDGSEQAAVALRAAVPLLRGCYNLHVLTVLRETPQGFPPTDAERYLARHGLKAELHELVRGDSVEQTLAEAASEFGAQLLVLGAYGHSRAREFLFGGVTRYFLEDRTSPALLLAH